MKCWGAVLDRSRATDEWYKLSQLADHLDVFVSHNWSMSRMDKFLILALYFNLRAAVFCTVLIVVVMASLAAVGVLPAWEGLATPICYDSSCLPVFIFFCHSLCFGVFISVLLCRQEVCRLLQYRGKLLFLDKACIHQSDASLKQRGIEHLAAFLHYSWDMLVCYSDDYLQKLWTVYEVSSFMLLHPGSAIHVSHPWYAKFLLAGMGILSVQSGLSQALSLEKEFPEEIIERSTEKRHILVSLMIHFPISIIMAVMVSNLGGLWVNMSARIKRFRFNDAACYNEADRTAVQHNIVIFMKHHGHVDTETSDADTIYKFEGMMHHDLPKLFAASLGRAGFPYHIAACIVLPHTLQGIGAVGDGIHKGVPIRTLFFRLAYPVVLELAAFPLCLAIQFFVARHLFQKYQVGRASCLCILSAIGFIFSGGNYVLLRITAALAAEGSHAEVLDFVLISACYSMAAIYFYKPPSHKKHHRHLSV
jgi:hypothetical protein